MLDALYAALAADPQVRAVGLGGSRARGAADEWSDVDLALDAPGWTPERLGGLWLGGQRAALGGVPFFHGVLADGTILDVLLQPPGEGYVLISPLPSGGEGGPPKNAAIDNPVLSSGAAFQVDGVRGDYSSSAEGPALDFWLNSMKHAKAFGRGVGGMVAFGLHHDAMALLRLWVLEDVGQDPGPGAFSIFGLTPIVRDHLTPDRLRLLGMPKRDEGELRAAARALRDAASEAGRKAEGKWGVPYPHRLEAVVRERWAV